MRMIPRILGAFVFVLQILAQSPPPRSVLGTVSAFRPESAEMELKTDAGAAVNLRFSATTISQKIAPGQTDLSKAQPVSITDIAIGDRVLAILTPDGLEAKRVVVIPATDLAKRDATDKTEWQQHGIAGVVTSVNGNEIGVELRSLGGATKYTVVAGPKTSFKRYAPDSVRYADAKDSSAAEVHVGDHLRARGPKNEAGNSIAAEAVVFGTFLSKAGTIMSINVPQRELTIKDLGNNKPLVVQFAADSHVKRMPEAGAMGAMLAGARSAQGAAPVPPRPANAPAAVSPRPGAGQGGARPDITQMLELLPPIRLEDLKTGEVVVLSAIQGSKPDRITALTFVANAEVLVQMAMAARGNTGPAPSLAGLAGSISNVGP